MQVKIYLHELLAQLWKPQSKAEKKQAKANTPRPAAAGCDSGLAPEGVSVAKIGDKVKNKWKHEHSFLQATKCSKTEKLFNS